MRAHLLALLLLCATAPLVAQTTGPLSADEAARLEASLAEKPDDAAARVRLLNYLYSQKPNADTAAGRAARLRHIKWFVENQPEHPVLIAQAGTMVPGLHRFADPEGCAEIAKLWRAQMKRSDLPVRAYSNAAHFFRFSDRKYAHSLLDQAIQLHPSDRHLLHDKGMLYALSLSGATAGDIYGYPAEFNDDPRTSIDAGRAREELARTNDADLLIGAGVQFSNLGIAAAGRTEGFFELGEGYLRRALQLRPRDGWAEGALCHLYQLAAARRREPAARMHLLELANELAHDPYTRAYLLPDLASAHFDNGQTELAARDAEELLKLASSPSSPNYAGAIHEANTILGRLALRKGDVAEARSRLLASARTTGSFSLSTVGPKWTLAAELLDKGERDAVLEYITACRAFWQTGRDRLDVWEKAIKEGGTPNFRGVSLPVQTRNLVGTPAPELRLKDLRGREVDLASYKGKVVMLDFWATWCGPCRAELPTFEKLHHQFEGKDAAIVTVNVGEDDETVSKFMAKEKYTFPVLLAEDRQASRAFQVNAFPTLVIVDKQGRIADFVVGSRREADLRAALDRGRAGAPAAPAASPSPTPASANALPAPVLVSPPDGSVFHHFPRAMLLTWSPVANAAAYEVEHDFRSGGVWGASDGTSVLQRATETCFSFSFAGAQPGRWRVRAIDAAGKPGAFSQWREFRFTK